MGYINDDDGNKDSGDDNKDEKEESALVGLQKKQSKMLRMYWKLKNKLEREREI